EPVRRPSTPTPTARHEGKTAEGDEIIKRPLYSRHPKGGAAVPLAREARATREYFTLGCRGYQSSTRVGSVAPLGNQEEVEYYRNDSLKYCRHEEKRRRE
ncbi:hypothetical protein LX36DRAFT_533087, partial [Colletotrichum falcatum]